MMLQFYWPSILFVWASFFAGIMAANEDWVAMVLLMGAAMGIDYFFGCLRRQS